MKFIRNWKISLPVAGVVLAGLAWLAFGFFGIHTAFVDEEVSEAAPEFDALSAPADAEPPVDAEPDDDTTVATDAPESVATDAAAGGATEPAPDQTAPAVEIASAESDESAPAENAPAETTPADTAPAETVPPETAPPATAPEIVTEASGAFEGTSRYDVSGEAIVLGNGTGQRFLRFEDFESSNGPDLNVYLFNPNDSSDFIDLGDLKGNIGEQNYEIPVDVDLSVYSEVSIWCVRFGTGFGSADLVAA